MASALLRKAFPLTLVEPEPVYILKGITPLFEYDEDGNRTSKIAGYRYEAINTNSLDLYFFKVEQREPLMQPKDLEVLREQGKRVFVEFEGATIRAYYSTKLKDYEDSFRAEGVHIVKNAG